MTDHAWIDPDAPDTELAIRGGCVRLYSDGPAIHANPLHIATGLDHVEIGPEGWLWVHHRPGWPVVAILPVPDETLAGRGILTGASGGTGYSRVKFTQVTASGPVELDLRDPAHYARVAGTYSNLWFLVVGIRARTRGLPSKADRALALVEALRARMHVLDPTAFRLDCTPLDTPIKTLAV